MIVNPAYIYMGSGGGEPVNPYLWQDGVYNYPVEFSGAHEFSEDGLDLTSAGATATFSELQLTGFRNLTVTAGNGFISSRGIKLTVEFLNSNGQSLGTETATFFSSERTQAVTIPSSARIKNAKIKIGWVSSHLILKSAVLS